MNKKTLFLLHAGLMSWGAALSAQTSPPQDSAGVPVPPAPVAAPVSVSAASSGPGAPVPVVAVPPLSPQIDPRVKELLEAFGKYYSGLRNFQVDVRATMRLEMDGGAPAGAAGAAAAQPRAEEARLSVAVAKPDRFVVMQQEGASAGFLALDGKTCTIYTAASKQYQSLSLIELLFPDRRRPGVGEAFLGRTGLLRDLLVGDPSRGLVGGAMTGGWVGTEKVGEIPAYHVTLASRTGSGIDLWIASGKEPLLLRFMTTRGGGMEAMRPPMPANPAAAAGSANATASAAGNTAAGPRVPPRPRMPRQVVDVLYENWKTEAPAPAEVFSPKLPPDAVEMAEPGRPGIAPIMPEPTRPVLPMVPAPSASGTTK